MCIIIIIIVIIITVIVNQAHMSCTLLLSKTNIDEKNINHACFFISLCTSIIRQVDKNFIFLFRLLSKN